MKEDVTLEFFENLAKESESCDELIKKIKLYTNVPKEVADEFYKKYNPKYVLLPEEAVLNMYTQIKG